MYIYNKSKGKTTIARGGGDTRAEWSDARENFLQDKTAQMARRKSIPEEGTARAKAQNYEIQSLEEAVRSCSR